VSLLAIAAGEVRQRLREPAFLILLVALAAGTTLLVPGPHDDYATLTIGGNNLYGGSSFAGTSAGLDFGVFAGFFCIFALGSGFARDDRTHLSELLRAQPIRTIGLVMGRVLASWALGAALVVGAMLLLGTTLVFREGATFQPLVYARNFLLLALPTTWFVASVAVLLDVLLGRWRGFLIAAGLIGYITLLGVSAPSHSRAVLTGAFDFSGLSATRAELEHTFGPGMQLGAGLQAGGLRGKPVFWAGLAPDASTVVLRLETVALAALLGLLATACYRRRAGISLRGAKAIEPRRSEVTLTTALFRAPQARGPTIGGRVANELVFRVRKNPLLACATAGLFVFALLGTAASHHWIIVLALLLPLFWIRVFDDALRPRSLDETLGALPGGLGGDLRAKSITLSVLCAAPLAGFLLNHTAGPMLWLVATFGILVEIAWLTTMAWVVRLELLALGVAAVWWYVISFNQVPPPIDYAGLWIAPPQTLLIDAIAATALVATSYALLSRARQT
jgi:hypothetical protein